MDDDKPRAEQWDEKDPRSQERYERAKAKAKAKVKANGHSELPPSARFDTTAAIKERLWLCPAVGDKPPHIPLNNVTLLSGEGGVGKSILAQQLGCTVAHNALPNRAPRDWLGLIPRGGSVMEISCEEDMDELNRRQEDICQFLGVTRAELAPLMWMESWVDEDDTPLVMMDKRIDAIKLTRQYQRLARDVALFKPTLLILDTVADLFGGSEIIRNQVRSFLAYLRKLTRLSDPCGILLLAHPSLEGIRSGTGLSGSTAWHNSVRGRCVFRKPKPVGKSRNGNLEDPGEPDNGDLEPNVRELEWHKSNYGPPQETITLQWSRGIWVPQGSDEAATLAQQLRMRNVEAAFLEVVRERNEQERPVSDKPGTNYAPTQIAQHGKVKQVKPRITPRELSNAMQRLFESNRIHIELRPRGRGRAIVDGPKPMPQEAKSDG